MAESQIRPASDEETFRFGSGRSHVDDLARTDWTTAGGLTFAYSKPRPADTDEAACEQYAGDVLRYMGKADHRASEVIGEKIDMVHFFAHRASVRIEEASDEYGGAMYRPVDRLVIIDTDDATYECVSEGVVQSILVLCQLPGSGHPSAWKKPRAVTFKQIPVRNTFRTFKLELWTDPEKRKGKKAG